MQILTGLGDLGKWPGPMAFSPDGRYLGAGDTEAFRLWDLSVGPSPVWARPQFNDYLRQNFGFAPDSAWGVGVNTASRARCDMPPGAKPPAPPIKNPQHTPPPPGGGTARGAARGRGGGPPRPGRAGARGQ